MERGTWRGAEGKGAWVEGFMERSRRRGAWGGGFREGTQRGGHGDRRREGEA